MINNSEGWVKLHRSILKNPIINKDSDHLAVWVFIILNATFKEINVSFKGKKRSLVKGQLVSTRKEISIALSIEPTKVWRILKEFNNEQLIEQETVSRYQPQLNPIWSGK